MTPVEESLDNISLFCGMMLEPIATSRPNMAINDASALETLRAIEDELTRIENSFRSGALPDRAASGALLFRQAELLVEKSKLCLAHKDAAMGHDSARQALGIMGGIAAIDEAEFQAKMMDLSASATACLGLAQCEWEDWFAARQTLGRLTAEAVQRNSVPVVEVTELASRVAVENAERRRRFERIVAEQESSRTPLAPHWEAAEIELDRLIEEIAQRIAQAKSILAGVPHPDRFETWLLERLGYFLKATPPPADSPVPASENSHFISEATAQGRRLQLQIWSSDEMYYAANFEQNGSEAVTDELLKPSREYGRLGLPHPDDPAKFAYPKWQFNNDHQEGIRAALLRLRDLPEWARWNYFHTTSPLLRGLSPLQFLGISDFGHATKNEATRIAILVKEHGSVQAAVAAATDAYLRGDD